MVFDRKVFIQFKFTLRMLKKFLEEVVNILVGKQSREIVDLLYSSKHVNEFLIAKKLGLTINQVRNILYKLADFGLVSSTRKKDKKKGWYTYFWKIEVFKSLEYLRNIYSTNVDQMVNQIKSRELKQFYVCETCNVEYTEENALAYDFTCPECGNVFAVKDNTKVLKDLAKNLEKLKKDLEMLDVEIKIEQEKISKEFEKDKKKKLEEKKTLRDLASKARKSAKNALEKSLNKKKNSKKTKKVKTKPKINKKKKIKSKKR